MCRPGLPVGCSFCQSCQSNVQNNPHNGLMTSVRRQEMPRTLLCALAATYTDFLFLAVRSAPFSCIYFWPCTPKCAMPPPHSDGNPVTNPLPQAGTLPVAPRREPPCRRHRPPALLPTTPLPFRPLQVLPPRRAYAEKGKGGRCEKCVGFRGRGYCAVTEWGLGCKM